MRYKNRVSAAVDHNTDPEFVRPGHPVGGQEERSRRGLERRRQDRAGVLGAGSPSRDALAAGHELLLYHRLRHHAGERETCWLPVNFSGRPMCYFVMFSALLFFFRRPKPRERVQQ